MKNRPLLPRNAAAEQAEIAEVRAQVQRALASDPPDLGVLTTALERVDALISSAQDELIAVVRELEGPSAAERAVNADFLAVDRISCVRNLLPW